MRVEFPSLIAFHTEGNSSAFGGCSFRGSLRILFVFAVALSLLADLDLDVELVALYLALFLVAVVLLGHLQLEGGLLGLLLLLNFRVDF